MILRHITAGLLVVLLLCGTAVAGACALRCELGATAQACGQGSGDEAMVMPSGHCHGVGMMQEDSKTVSRAVMSCGHAVVSVAAVDDDPVVPMGVPLLVVVEAALPAPGQSHTGWKVFKRPPRSVAGSLKNLIAVRI